MSEDDSRLKKKRGGYHLLNRSYTGEAGPGSVNGSANASCGLAAKLTANAIPSVAPMLIPYIIAHGRNAKNLLTFSDNDLNIRFSTIVTQWLDDLCFSFMWTYKAECQCYSKCCSYAGSVHHRPWM